MERLTPHFARIVFRGDDLEHVGTGGLDQRIKIVFPLDGVFADLGQEDGAGDWYDRWRSLPDAERNPFRTYTVRRPDPAARELTVDFVIHHDAGPAGTWAENATPGDRVIVVGPDSRSPHHLGGIDWHPGAAQRLLLVGDETAAPAICSILESLPADVVAEAFVEIPTGADALPLGDTAHHVTWLARDDAAHGTTLIDAVTQWAGAHTSLLSKAAAPRAQVLEDVDVDRELIWDAPLDVDGEFYAWIAGESATIKTLRRLLVTTHGVDRKRVAFMGYWREGQAERIG